MSSVHPEPTNSTKTMTDESKASEAKVLETLGYEQVLHRGWNSFTNFSVAVSSMSVLLSITASMWQGLYYGGPVSCLWGWFIASIGSMAVALGMAELASAYPTSGGMYYWIARLSPPSYGPCLCWVTGWLNLLGQLSSLASTHYAMMNMISSIVLLSTGTNAPTNPDYLALDYADIPAGPGYTFSKYEELAIYAACILLTTTINSLKFEHVAWITELGGIWHVVGIIILAVVIPSVATKHATATWVFTAFEHVGANSVGIYNPFYIFIIGLLLPAYAFTGFDGPAHMTEESHNAAIAAPQGIVRAVLYTMVFGWIWVVSLLFCVSNYDQVVGGHSEAAGNPIPQIFWDAFKQRTGSGVGGIIFLIIPLGGIYFCAHSTLTYVARIMFCYSRDRAIPLSHLWVVVNKRTQSPLVALWATAFLTFLLGLPMLGDAAAFNAILSLSTIALNIAYVLPFTARISWGRHRFQPGPWHLGRWALPIGIVANIWVAFIVVVFSLPTEYPVASSNLNFAGIMLLAVLFLSLVYFWCPYVGAYRWFLGPVRTAEEEGSSGDSSGSKHQPPSEGSVVRKGALMQMGNFNDDSAEDGGGWTAPLKDGKEEGPARAEPGAGTGAPSPQAGLLALEEVA